MGQWNHKSIIYTLLAGCWVGLSSLLIYGCSDNPDAEAAKKMRSQTTEAVQESVIKKDYDAAQRTVMASLQTNRSQGLTKDAALLASGNLALAKAQQMQMDLRPKVLQLRTSTNELEKTLRASEENLLEREKIEMLLATQDQEIIELKKLLNGDDQTEGLSKQLEQVDAQMQQLLTNKKSLQSDRDQVQTILDKHQKDADDLMRQAELSTGDTRLDLEKQSFSILQQRKEHYIKAQSLENQIAVLDEKIELIQIRFDGLTQNIQEIQGRIEEVDSSSTRKALKQQLQEIGKAIRDDQNRLSSGSREVTTAIKAYLKASEDVLAVYEEAIAELQKIHSRDVEFASTARMADIAYHAAMTCSRVIRTQKDLSERLQDLLDTADPTLISAMQGNLPIQQDVNTDYKKKTFAYFDQSIETYEKAAMQATGLGADAKCSLLKSELLALYSKMQLADLLSEFDLANSTETAIQDLIQKGEQLGVSFTQSEAMRVVANEGINYLPSIPLNMEVFVEGKKQEFSAWKKLPINEQEAAVEENLQEIDELVAKYGQDMALQLETLKQEMLSAKERGFKEPEPAAARTRVSSREPNSLY